MKTVLITGGSGLLGGEIVQLGRDRYDVVTTYLNHEIHVADVDCLQVDLTKYEQVEPLGRFDPDSIIHCAALADVDRCERDPEAAHAHNVGITQNVARLASNTNSRLVHISTDAVFSGREGRYAVTDEPDPVNVYGRTKLEAESVVQDTHDDSVVVRTNIYGWNTTSGQSLAEWMISKLRRGERVLAFEDAYFTPIYTGDLVPCLFELVENDFTGTLHVAGRERCSKYEFANIIADVFDLDETLIDRASVADADFDAPRGRDLSLSVDRTQEQLDCELPRVRDGLEHMLRDENE